MFCGDRRLTQRGAAQARARGRVWVVSKRSMDVRVSVPVLGSVFRSSSVRPVLPYVVERTGADPSLSAISTPVRREALSVDAASRHARRSRSPARRGASCAAGPARASTSACAATRTAACSPCSAAARRTSGLAAVGQRGQRPEQRDGAVPGAPAARRGRRGVPRRPGRSPAPRWRRARRPPAGTVLMPRGGRVSASSAHASRSSPSSERILPIFSASRSQARLDQRRLQKT